MKFKVLVTDSLAEEGLTIFKNRKGILLDNRPGLSRDELLKIIGDYDALVVRSKTKPDAGIIQAGKSLKIIGRAGIGVDNIDLEAATKAGVMVMNTPEGNAITTAEHTIALILSLVRNVAQATSSLKEGKWEKKKFLGRELTGKTLGVLGLGNIGRLVVERAQGLKMRVIASDPYFSAEAAQKLGVAFVEFDELIRLADVLTVHTPLNDETRGIVSDAEIAQMKDGVFIINCARGGIYDEDALLRGLNKGKIAGVALDVFTQEPPPKDHPLLVHPNFICTPHLGASTKEAQVNVAVAIANQICSYADGALAHNVINLPHVSEADMKWVGPYMGLAKKMGAFCAQRSEGKINRIEITFCGELAQHDTTPLARAVLIGAISKYFSRPVNAVNARFLAEERGIEIVQSQSNKCPYGFGSTVRVVLMGTERYEVTGTLFEGGHGRFVDVDGIPVEVLPEGHMLVVRNLDKPGVVGKVGTILGEAGINISRMHLGLDRDAGQALAIISIDMQASASVQASLLEGAGVTSVHQVEI